MRLCDELVPDTHPTFARQSCLLPEGHEGDHLSKHPDPLELYIIWYWIEGCEDAEGCECWGEDGWHCIEYDDLTPEQAQVILERGCEAEEDGDA